MGVALVKLKEMDKKRLRRTEVWENGQSCFQFSDADFTSTRKWRGQEGVERKKQLVLGRQGLSDPARSKDKKSQGTAAPVQQDCMRSGNWWAARLLFTRNQCLPACYLLPQFPAVLSRVVSPDAHTTMDEVSQLSWGRG